MISYIEYCSRCAGIELVVKACLTSYLELEAAAKPRAWRRL